MSTKQVIIPILFVFFSLGPAYTQRSTTDYSAKWESVYQLEKQQLTQSAASIVDSIYNIASAEKNQIQLIKALMYKSKYILFLEEDAQLKVIRQIKDEISKSKLPEKRLLQCILANLYWQYFDEHRWIFYDRTHTHQPVDKEDFRTWDLETLFNEIHFQFQNSLKDPKYTQTVDLHQFNELLLEVETSKKYRPTLFDFLAHNALNFYQKDEITITNPSYSFTLDDPQYFDDLRKISLQTADSLSLQYHALIIYQQLMNFHSDKTDPFPLVDANLHRLSFVKSHSIIPDKEELYYQALLRLKEQYKHHEVSVLIDHRLAMFYYELGEQYQPNVQEENRFKKQDALAICEKVLKEDSDTYATEACLNLKNTILSKSLQIQIEKHIPVNRPSRMRVDYKNIDLLDLKIFRVSEEQEKSFQRLPNDSAKLSFIQRLLPVKHWKAELKNENDYQNHTTELVIQALPAGMYLIFSNTSDLDKEGKLFGYSFFQVTDLALVEKNDMFLNIFQVIDRQTGKPVSGATVLFTSSKYNTESFIKSFTTNKEGELLFKADKHYYSTEAKVIFKDDTANFSYYYLSSYEEEDKQEIEYPTPFIFTDRSIYRPGQTVYFKGILVRKKSGKSMVVQNESVEVVLENMQGQELTKHQLKTNEFGSFSGKFDVPGHGITGLYSITVREDRASKSKFYEEIRGFNWNKHYISVEEYKRPKFQVSFEPLTETYLLNDTIGIEGLAKAYAGSIIAGAQVDYRIRRKAHLPPWRRWGWDASHLFGTPQEITHGVTTTNDAGEFYLKFAALPDNKVPKELLPVFYYEITVDVTDINGETRSATTIVKAGYHSLTAEVRIPVKVNREKKRQKVEISSQNLNGEFVPAKGSMKVYKLKAPEYVLRKRVWKAPDYHSLSEAEFKLLFPHDPYKNEDQPETWDKEKLCFETSFDTYSSREVYLQNIHRWASGKYMIELETKDDSGQDVLDRQIFQLFSPKDKVLADNQLFEYTLDKEYYQPGDKVKLQLGSAADNLWVTINIKKGNQITKTQIVHLKKNRKEIKIPVTQEDASGFSIHFSFAAFNEYSSGYIPVYVRQEVEALEIETITFRDKLLPDEEQTWSFRIKGKKGEKLVAELLAGMYDASLDQFTSHRWRFDPLQQDNYFVGEHASAYQSFGTSWLRIRNDFIHYIRAFRIYDELNWFGLNMVWDSYELYDMLNIEEIVMIPDEETNVDLDLFPRQYGAFGMADRNAPPPDLKIGYSANQPAFENTQRSWKDTKQEAFHEQNDMQQDPVLVRKNLQETAFFFPHLTTDQDGSFSFTFTTPEALTKWKVQLLAHTKELASVSKILETVTQKELMIIPNPPRFLREGDEISFSAKIANISANTLEGVAELQLFDAVTGNSLDEEFQNVVKQQAFTSAPQGSTVISWILKIPSGVHAVQYKIIARAGSFSDGEQNVLPVLTNRTLVTETLPLWTRANQSRSFTLNKLRNHSSGTLKHHKLTLEMASNPAWYAVQALPYLMEYPYECAEQVFSRYYANALAGHIVNSNPQISQVFEKWRTSSEALKSNLEKNQELKSLIIEETPWLREAQTETEQKKQLARLFDQQQLEKELYAALLKLQELQLYNGAFPWFQGGYPNRYITQHIVAGIGHLKHLGLDDTETHMVSERALNYLDLQIFEDYQKLREVAGKTSSGNKKNSEDILQKNNTGPLQIHYLYMRSFYPEKVMTDEVKEAVEYFKEQTATYWTSFNRYLQGMIALSHSRTGDSRLAQGILLALKENSTHNEETGRYWKENVSGWLWHESAIEAQALLIEVFSEIQSAFISEQEQSKFIEDMKVWLLKNKQTRQWKSTKATAEAVYALLLQGKDLLAEDSHAEISVGKLKVEPGISENDDLEPGTGYFKTSWQADEISADMAEVQISNSGKSIAWGGLYWQYFEDLDKITSASSPLSIAKKLFLKKNSDRGEVLHAVNDDTTLKVGDLVRVRIELKVDRDMDFVHMKDMRAAGFEPVNVFSQFRYQDGLGYYESTRDTNTSFFFETLRKGIYVFEYDLRVNNKGSFSNGITTIQCMYAPEFSSHSEGVRVLVTE